MKIFFLYALTLLLSANLYARTYYVSSSQGKDSYKGTSASKPWKSLKKINRSNFKPGDRVLFKRGDVWRGQLIPNSSGNSRNYIYYGAYGEGNKPLFLGSIFKGKPSDWKYKDQNIWQTKLKRTKDVGNMICDNNADVVTKREFRYAIKEVNDFYSHRNKLYIKSKANPGNIYKNIEIAVTKDIISVVHKDYLFFENLAVKFGGAHGIYCHNVSNITIKSCESTFIGGGLLGPDERYGNGIEFWRDAYNCLVEDCFVDQIYDAGLTNQGDFEVSTQKNITYRNNRISNCGLTSFAYFNRPASSVTSNIVFENNISKDVGFGWAERPGNYGGYHMIFHRNSAKTDNIVVRNNDFYNSRKSAIIFFSEAQWNGYEEVFFENNNYHEKDKNHYLFRKFTDGKGWENYKFSEKEKYIKNVKKDKTSRFE